MKISPEQAKVWMPGKFEQWADESFGIAQAKVYVGSLSHGATDTPVILPPGYAAAQSGIVSIQLEKAGVRLAGLLNAVFPEQVNSTKTL